MNRRAPLSLRLLECNGKQPVDIPEIGSDEDRSRLAPAMAARFQHVGSPCLGKESHLGKLSDVFRITGSL